MKAGKSLRVLATCGALALILLPASFFVSLMLIPLWRWAESDLGIESIGHSGPGEWCFALVYLLLVSACLIICLRMARR